jgi:hypothetical protein
VTSVGITFGTSGTDINASGSPVTSSGNITINLPTASATNRGALSSADWTTFNSKQPAGNYVTLDTVQTITAQKTFTTSGSSDTMIISHGSGSGFALDVLKAGNGEAIRVQKTSGSGNAMTISGGNFEAGTIVKTGGTSSQFLKADGSVDSSTYLTTGTAGSTYVPYTGAGANVDLGVYNITSSAVNVNGSGSNAGVINLESNTIFPLVNGYGTIGSGTTNQFNFYQTTGAGVFRGAILSLNSITASATRTFTFPDATGTLALTSDIPSVAGVYLPLAGGTLTGALNGTSANFSGSVGIGTNTPEGSGLTVASGGILVSLDPGANRKVLELYATSTGAKVSSSYVGASSYGSLELLTSGLARLTIASTGEATFSSSVTATGATFSGTTAVASVGGTSQMRIDRSGSVARIQNYDTGSAANISLAYDGGNVGIGTASPAWMLEVNKDTASGSFGAYPAISVNNPNAAGFSAYYFFSGATNKGGFEYSNSSNDLSIYGNDAERMRITSSGDCVLKEGGTFIASTSTGGAYGMIIQNTSNNTSATPILFRGWDGSTTGSIATYVNLTTYNTSSDYRLKEDLRSFSGLDMVSKLKMYDFKWKEADWRMYGGLAHEIAAVVPYAVNGEKDAVDKDGSIQVQGVDYSTLVPVLVKAIQELKTEIDSLKNQIK